MMKHTYRYSVLYFVALADENQWPNHIRWYSDATPVYARGCHKHDGTPFKIEEFYESGFCKLMRIGRSNPFLEYCLEGKYGGLGDKLYRVEDLSPTPWKGEKVWKNS